ncbi:hypothetical protein IT575_08875 [bacterium]|nr:hypothetical protein [bacterium]
MKPALAAYGIDARVVAAAFQQARVNPHGIQLINELLCDARPWQGRALNELSAWIETEPLALPAIWELTDAQASLAESNLSETEFLRQFNRPEILRHMVYLALDFEEKPELPRCWLLPRSGASDSLAFLQLILRWAGRFAAWQRGDLRQLRRLLLQYGFPVVATGPQPQGGTGLLLDAGTGVSENYMLDLLEYLGVAVLRKPAGLQPTGLSGWLAGELGLPLPRLSAKQQRLEFKQAGGTENSLFIVRAIGGVDGYDVRGALGPDLGLIIDIGDKEVTVSATAYIERHIIRIINEHTELAADYEQGRLRLRWYEHRLEAGDLGRIIYEALKSQFVLNTISVNLIFDPLRISSLRPAILAYREDRENQLRRRSEDSSPLVLCSSCSSYMPQAFCIASADRTPCCGRSYDELATLALFSHSTEQRIVERGSVTDKLRGAYLGVDKLAQILSEGGLRRINLHSLREQPHPSTAIPEVIAWFIDELDAFNLLSRDFSGRSPDGKTFDTLLARVAGRQSPGYMGISESYVLSPRFLAAEGGVARVAWMNASLKARLKISSEQIATENDCINMAGLKSHLSAWRK